MSLKNQAPTGQLKQDFETRSIAIDTNLKDKEYFAVNYDGTDEGVVNIASTATAIPYVLENGGDGSTNETTGTIVLSGVTKVKIGGAVQEGARLTSNADGEWVATTTANNQYGAIALDTGVDGDVIPASIERGTI